MCYKKNSSEAFGLFIKEEEEGELQIIRKGFYPISELDKFSQCFLLLQMNLCN